jgi:uncharacterized protein (TIRG00374 family)
MINHVQRIVRSHPAILFVLKSIIAAGLLFALIQYIKFETIVDSLSQMKRANLIVSVALSCVLYVLLFVRWKYLVAKIDETVRNKEIISSLFIGRAFGFFTPFQFGDIIGRILTLRTIPRSHVFGLVVIEKLFTSITAFLIGITGTALFVSQYFHHYWHAGYGLIVAFLWLILAGLILVPQSLNGALNLLPRWRFLHRFSAFVAELRTYLHQKDAVMIFAITASCYGVSFLQYYVFFNAFEHITLGHTIIGIACVIFINNFLLPISLGDLGVRESASIFFFGYFGISAATAFNVAFMIYVANAVIPGIIGALLIFQRKFTLRRLGRKSPEGTTD